MAGQFESVIDIRGLDAFTVAVKRVLVSRERAGAGDQPIAVLVQPLIEPTSGGVMFGIDPVTGRSDRRVISAVHGAPEQLVSGEVRGSRYLLEPNAKVIEFDANDGPQLTHTDLRRLIASATRSPRSSGAHKTSSGRSRKTASCGCSSRDPSPPSSPGTPGGPIFGPGPVAETFPEPLTELECDLWVPPLREALREAVVLAGAATRAQVDASDVVITVDGHVAIDLQLAGEIPPKHSVLQKLNPVLAAHHLRAAWRVGRLRAALPRLAENLLDSVDADLEAVPALDAAHELPAHRVDASEPRDPALVARPRDHDGDAHPDRPQPDDRAHRWRCACWSAHGRTA